jgi:hypothetical protein
MAPGSSALADSDVSPRGHRPVELKEEAVHHALGEAVTKAMT